MAKSKYKLNLRQSLLDPRDWKAENVYAAGSLPEKFSMVKQLTNIKDQGSYGTCAAQVAACIKEYHEFKEDGLLEDFSPMFVYAHRTPEGVSGMYPRDVMKIMRNFGGVANKDYKYIAKNRDKYNITGEIYDKAKNFIIRNYALISTVDAAKRALIADGPVFMGLPVYNFGETFWKAGFGDTSIGGHAVTLVGYDKDGFILRNSWGTSWGDYGYTLFPYKDWGIQWEAWTTVDKESFNITDYEYKAEETGDPTSSWISKLFKLLIGWIRSWN